MTKGQHRDTIREVKIQKCSKERKTSNIVEGEKRF